MGKGREKHVCVRVRGQKDEDIRISGFSRLMMFVGIENGAKHRRRIVCDFGPGHHRRILGFPLINLDCGD